jgi:hypothetical protein
VVFAKRKNSSVMMSPSLHPSSSSPPPALNMTGSEQCHHSTWRYRRQTVPIRRTSTQCRSKNSAKSIALVCLIALFREVKRIQNIFCLNYPTFKIIFFFNQTKDVYIFLLC